MENNIMRLSLKEMIARLKESGSTSDFPLLLGDNLHKVLIDSFKSVPSNWRLWTYQSDLVDFRKHYRDMLSEAEELLEEVEGEGVKDSKLTEAQYSVFCKTYSRAFSVTRKTIINDDLDAIIRRVTSWGRTAGRKAPKLAIALLEGNGPAYDNTAFFDNAHGNIADNNLVSTQLGASYVVAAVNAVKAQKDLSGKEVLGLKPKYLVVPSVLLSVANVLCNADYIPNAVGTLVTNEAKGLVQPLEEQFLTSAGTASKWYVVCDPFDSIGVEIGFLNGQQEPELFKKKSDSEKLIGGGTDDEFGFEVAECKYKVRYELGVALGDYRGWYRGKS